MDNGFPATPGLSAAVARLNAGYDVAERRQAKQAARRVINAAAPELLAALKGLLDTCLGEGWSNEEYLEKLTAGGFKHPDMAGPYARRVLAARVAIAKAEGRS